MFVELRGSMQVTEDLVREIAAEAMLALGPQASPVTLKKVVSEVIRRLTEGEDGKTHSSAK